MEIESLSTDELAKTLNIARSVLQEVLSTGRATKEVCESFYSYAYLKHYRLNRVKEEMAKETNLKILFHGSKNGLNEISIEGSRVNCDFGRGFYLGESYEQALSFVCDNPSSSVYSFVYDCSGLTVKTCNCDLDWMLAISFNRGRLGEYANKAKIQKIMKGLEEADVIIAPIADNRMFYIMNAFIDGEINADAALHSLSASNLGKQYVLKTERALSRLQPIEKYYLSTPEKENAKQKQIERFYEIETKLKLAKRQFKEGLYIEEILK